MLNLDNPAHAAAEARLRQDPRVCLHLDGNGEGGGIVIFEGTATVDRRGPRRARRTGTWRSTAREGLPARHQGHADAGQVRPSAGHALTAPVTSQREPRARHVSVMNRAASQAEMANHSPSRPAPVATTTAAATPNTAVDTSPATAR